MAAAIIPIVAPVAMEIIHLIAGLVHQSAPAAEVRYGPATGAVKSADVFGAVMGELQRAAAVGTIPKQLPSDEVIKIIIEAVVSSMQLSGTLASPASVAGPIKLAPGQTITIAAAN